MSSTLGIYGNRMLKRLIVLTTIVISGCAVGTISEQTGGHGVVFFQGVPVVGAKVSILDVGGSLTGTTDSKGEFRIVGVSRKAFYSFMENPVYHDVIVRVEKADAGRVEHSVRRSVFEGADVDFGHIELSDH